MLRASIGPGFSHFKYVRNIYIKTALYFSAGVLIFALSINIFPFTTGFTGVTKKNGGAGCVCHSFEQTNTVSVFFTGPDSVPIGQTVLYKISISHGPAIGGGVDIASWAGTLDTSYIDSTLKRDPVAGELTHRFPKVFSNDTVSWTFRYTAPNTPQVDTLYAVGNSVNFNHQADTLDRWNFSPNFPVRIYIPISVKNQNEIVSGFELSQNYPNPFNPITSITYTLSKADFISLKVYDIRGGLAAELVNMKQKEGKYTVEFDGTNLSSGVYFYTFKSGDFVQTRTMILLK